MLGQSTHFTIRAFLGTGIGCLAYFTFNLLVVAQQGQDDSIANTAPKTQQVQVENALLKTIESTKVAAEIAGKIDQITVVEGSDVTLGQSLGNIRDSAIRVQLERSKITMAIARKKQRSDIDLKLAQKKNDVAQNELERAEAANKRIPNTYGPKEVDRLRLMAESTVLEIERAKHEQEVAELEVMLAENEYRQAEELLARHQILSPAIGVIVAVNKRAGEWVEPGAELFEIVKTDRLRIEGFVSTVAAGKMLKGRAANVTVLTADHPEVVAGKVVFVSPDANPVNGQVRIFLEIDNSRGKFRPGMRVNATIDLNAESSTLKSETIDQP